MDGDLASTHSAEENACAAATIPSYLDVEGIDYVWIGMVEDEFSEGFGPWTWVDGTEMNYMNHNDELLHKEWLCGLMHSDFENALGEWDDGGCDGADDEDEYPFICKLPL